MRTPVLIESRRVGASSWVAVRDPRTALEVAGMAEGDTLHINLGVNGSFSVWKIPGNGRHAFPYPVERVQAVHAECNGVTRINVDLVI